MKTDFLQSRLILTVLTATFVVGCIDSGSDDDDAPSNSGASASGPAADQEGPAHAEYIDFVVNGNNRLAIKDFYIVDSYDKQAMPVDVDIIDIYPRDHESGEAPSFTLNWAFDGYDGVIFGENFLSFRLDDDGASSESKAIINHSLMNMNHVDSAECWFDHDARILCELPAIFEGVPPTKRVVGLSSLIDEFPVSVEVFSETCTHHVDLEGALEGSDEEVDMDDFSETLCNEIRVGTLVIN